MSTSFPFNENSIMPFGKHKGLKLKEVPHDWMRWFYKNLDHKLAQGLSLKVYFFIDTRKEIYFSEHQK